MRPNVSASSLSAPTAEAVHASSVRGRPRRRGAVHPSPSAISTGCECVASRARDKNRPRRDFYRQPAVRVCPLCNARCYGDVSSRRSSLSAAQRTASTSMASSRHRPRLRGEHGEAAAHLLDTLGGGEVDMHRREPIRTPVRYLRPTSAVVPGRRSPLGAGSDTSTSVRGRAATAASGYDKSGCPHAPPARLSPSRSVFAGGGDPPLGRANGHRARSRPDAVTFASVRVRMPADTQANPRIGEP